MSRLLVIVLDSVDPVNLEQWLDAGHLPHMARLRQGGTYARLRNSAPHAGGTIGFSATEPSWVVFSTGCYPGTSGYWDFVRYDPQTYDYGAGIKDRLYDYSRAAPFFDLGPDYRVSIFDLPMWAPSARINGPQVAGWGGHFTAGVSASQPLDLLDRLNRDFGHCEVLTKDHGSPWHTTYHDWLDRELHASIGKRGNIIRHLMQRDPWDLFIGTFLEAHSAGHDLLHYGAPEHPLFPGRSGSRFAVDPVLRVCQAIDREVGQIVAAMPDDTSLALCGVHGMGENHSDLLTMVFLPEFLYRWNFPGRRGFPSTDAGQPPGPVVRRPPRKSWTGSLWAIREEQSPLRRWLAPYLPGALLRGRADDALASPYRADLERLSWMPASWYRKQWPRMKAFALPTFWDGRVRVNLQGRDGQGIVHPDDYAALCDELEEKLLRLRDARSGTPVVKNVTRTRTSPRDDDPRRPAADLVVEWEERAVDVVESPDIGRIGPIPYMRAGGHRPRGFLLASGPDVEPGASISGGAVVDLAPTLLALLGAPVPKSIDGKPLILPRR